jgi:hypothetical protein
VEDWQNHFTEHGLEPTALDDEKTYLIVEVYHRDSFLRVTGRLAETSFSYDAEFGGEIELLDSDIIRESLDNLSSLNSSQGEASGSTKYSGRVDEENLDSFAEWLETTRQLLEHLSDNSNIPTSLIDTFEELSSVKLPETDDTNDSNEKRQQAFESIGDGSEQNSTHSPEEEEAIWVELPSAIEPSEALRADLRLRFPIETVGASDDSSGLRVKPASSADSNDLTEQLQTYMARVETFQRAGINLQDMTASVESRESNRKTARRTRSARSSEVPESDEVVFDFDDTGADSGIPSGAYQHPKLDRDDATTPLVDVVLRHPGYSRRNMGQVLTILLDIDYNQALEVIEKAPCIVGWNVSRNNALQLKDSIHNAGGRVLLVEPDYLEAEELT